MAVRLAVSGAVGVAVGLGSGFVAEGVTAQVLAGMCAAMFAYSLPLIWLFARLDEDQTKDHFAEVDPTRSEVEVLVVGAALSALVAVGVMLVLGRSIADAVLGMLTVGASWLAVHTTYTLRYAKHYLGAEPGCIEFQGSDGTPRFSDFAYLSFSLGMAYQVADTDLTTPAIRRTVWAHSMLSFLFGTVIIAASINLIVNLAQ